MVRIAALACLLLRSLAPAAAAAGARRPRRGALAAQMRSARARARARSPSTSTPGETIYALRAGHAADAGVGGEALHDGDGAAAPRRRRAADHDGARRAPAGRRGRRATATSTCAAAATRRSTRSTPTGSPQQVADAGIAARHRAACVGDESAFDTRRGVPSSALRLTSDVGPLSALTFNRGRTGARAPTGRRGPASFAADRVRQRSCASSASTSPRAARAGRARRRRRVPVARLALAADRRARCG